MNKFQTKEQCQLELLRIVYRCAELMKKEKDKKQFLDMYFDLTEQFLNGVPVLDFSD